MEIGSDEDEEEEDFPQVALDELLEDMDNLNIQGDGEEVVQEDEDENMDEEM